MPSHYLGKRFSFSDALCTVRYRGQLPGQDGDWLGVEWDDPDRGKHDGQYKGKQLFETLSSSPHCASFIRPTRAADKLRSFLEALRYKYAEESLEQAPAQTDGFIEISGKVVEEVGFERIRKQQALLQELKIVVLDGLRIRGTGDEAEVARLQDEIANTCSNITELDLSRNLLEHWSDVADICSPLKKLRVLKVSGLRLNHFAMDHASSLQNVEELHLSDCLLRPDQLLDMLCSRTERGSTRLHFPALISLSIAGNNFHSFDMAHIGVSDAAISTVSTLILDNNAFTSVVPLCKSIMQVFPNIATLSLQHNRVSAFTDPESTPEEPLPIYTSISSLNLSHNAIITPTLISSLPQIFPHLTSLRVSGNPFFHNPSSSSATRTDEAAFSLTLARLPALKTLNYSPITDKDRMDGELYYLSVAGKEISQLSHRSGGSPMSEDLQSLRQTWTRYEELCAKYEMENVFGMLLVSASNPSTARDGTPLADSERQTHPTSTARSRYLSGSLGARLVTITFLLSDNNDNSNSNKNKNDSTNQSHTLTLPLTLDIYRVKGLLLRAKGREWNLRPLAFDLDILSRPTSHSDSDSGEEVVSENGCADAEYEQIPDSTRSIGGWIPEGVGECVVRVRPREERGVEGGVQGLDLRKLMVL